MATNFWLWGGFVAFVLAMLALDLGVFHKDAHEVKPREAGIWVAVWVTLAMIFAAGLWYFEGSSTALTFITGYVIEESLSVDNLFVMVVIFNYFAVPPACQHRVLFYGILGALIMRGLFIGLGAALLARFEWILYVFGAMLLFTGIRMMFKHDEEFEGDQNPIVRLVRRFIPMTDKYGDKAFFVVENGKRLATPLLLVLILVEFTDLIFAVDSIHARPIPRLHVEHLRGAGPAVDVLPAGRGDRAFLSAQVRSRGDTLLHRRENAGREVLPHRHTRIARSRPWDARDLDRRVTALAGAG
jgi:tellurite resistance protein TerC